MNFRELFPLLFQINPSWFQVDTRFIIAMVTGVSVFTAISIIWGVRSHRKSISTGREDLIGRTAIVITALDLEGLVLVEGERWRARLDRGHAEPKEEVIITKVRGLKLWVTKKETV